MHEALGFIVLFLVGAIASGINAVAGGGTLVSFPVLTLAFQIPSREANATNAAALWPGSLSGAVGFANLLSKTKHHLSTLFLPTLIGAILGAYLLTLSSQRLFDRVIPFLILLASLLLLLQPRVKAFVQRDHRTLPVWLGIMIQFLVATYGGYFGAGMGIMMLGSFALYMDGTIHELNAVKNWLGLIINFIASVVFLAKGLILFTPFVALALGSLVGGFYAAKWSQKFDSEKLRLAIAAYGLIMTVYFGYRAFA